MTDPERISKRSSGLAGELLRASASEEPNAIGLERTLAALGVSSAAHLAGSSVAHAAANSAPATGAGVAGVKATSAGLLVKWIGLGLVGGVGLAGAGSVATGPASFAGSTPMKKPAIAVPFNGAAAIRSGGVAQGATELPAASAEPRPKTAPNLPAPPRPVDRALHLAAEVSLLDRVRSFSAAGRSEEGLALLKNYESQFPKARLLPEALFLRLELYDRLGRSKETRATAERLVASFPHSPHAARARALLDR